MAGLRIDGTSTKVTGHTANVAVTITPDGFVWADYQISLATDGWYVYGPDRAGTLALSPASVTTLEDKTFTPTHPGRYLFRVLATPAAGGDQVELTAVLEVTFAYGEAVPAPREQLEYDSNTGWQRSIEEHLLQAVNHLKYRVLKVKNSSMFTIPKHYVCYFTAFNRFNSAGSVTDLASDNPVDVLGEVSGISAVSDEVLYRDLYLALEDIASGDTGLVLVEGRVPLDTTSLTVADQSLIVGNLGNLVANTFVVTYKRVVGFTVTASSNETFATSPTGSVYFNGSSYRSSSAISAATVNVDNTASPYTIPTGMELVNVDCSSGAVDVTLPALATVGDGYVLGVRDDGGNAATNSVTVSGAGSDTIDGYADLVLQTDRDFVVLKSVAGVWSIVTSLNNVTDNVVEWETAAHALSGGVSALMTAVSTSAPVTAAGSDEIIVADTSTSVINITLPSITTVTEGTLFGVVDTGNNARTNAITITPDASDYIGNLGVGVNKVISHSGAKIQYRASPGQNTWVEVSTTEPQSPVIVPGGLVLTPTAVSATPYSVLSTDCLLEVDTSASSIVINLPAANTWLDGQVLVVVDKSRNAATNLIGLSPNGADTVNGATNSGPTYALEITTDAGAVWLYSNGVSDWIVIANT